MAVSTHYDSLLAKLVVHTPGSDFADVLRRSQRALAQCAIDGVATNLPLLRALAQRPEMASQDLDTGFVEAHLQSLWPAVEADPPTQDFTLRPPIADRRPPGAAMCGGW